YSLKAPATWRIMLPPQVIAVGQIVTHGRQQTNATLAKARFAAPVRPYINALNGTGAGQEERHTRLRGRSGGPALTIASVLKSRPEALSNGRPMKRRVDGWG